MAKKFLTAIDLNKNELQNPRAQNLGTAPGAPVAGLFYYDTTNNALYVHNGTSWRPADAAKLTDGSIQMSALATNPLARANHTGTQTASTISDFDTQVRASRLDQMAAPTAAVSMNNQRVTGVATPTAGTDAANKNYVDDAVAGLSWKNEVRVATVANGTLASAFANDSTVDGIALATGDRILIKDQSSPQENGIYTVNASGAPTRATDADSDTDMKGAAVFVSQGTTNAGTRWVCNTSGTITIGVTSLTFVTFGGGSSYTNGNGLNLAGNEFSVKPVAGGNITVGASGVDVDTTKVTRKFAGTYGNGALTSITVNHALNNQDAITQVRDAGTNAVVECDIVNTDANNVTLGFAVAPASNSIRVSVVG